MKIKVRKGPIPSIKAWLDAFYDASTEKKEQLMLAFQWRYEKVSAVLICSPRPVRLSIERRIMCPANLQCSYADCSAQEDREASGKEAGRCNRSPGRLSSCGMSIKYIYYSECFQMPIYTFIS